MKLNDKQSDSERLRRTRTVFIYTWWLYHMLDVTAPGRCYPTSSWLPPLIIITVPIFFIP